MNAALSRVFAGRVPAATSEEADDLWCRLVAQGRVLEQRTDGERNRSLCVHLTLLSHPSLPADEVYAIFALGDGIGSVYRTTPEDARLALYHPSAFNL